MSMVNWFLVLKQEVKSKFFQALMQKLLSPS
jgi:hypothetical protein